jgi:uncharacterized protein (TIGR03435 family)
VSNRIAWSVIVVMAAAGVYAQEFEVASVRPNTLNDRIVTIDVGPGGRFAARGYTLVLLIQRAYGVMDWNVTGGPGWIHTDRFDVVAKANVRGDFTEAQLQPMLQKLLAERFKLRLHRSSKEMPGYALAVAKGGPKVKASADSVEHPDTFRMGGNGLSGRSIPMADLARFVAGKLGLVGVDETGLQGLYDIKVEWKVEAEQSASDDPREALRFAVISALQEQLGLKLTAKKITVQMLAIDSVERASASEN